MVKPSICIQRQMMLMMGAGLLKGEGTLALSRTRTRTTVEYVYYVVVKDTGTWSYEYYYYATTHLMSICWSIRNRRLISSYRSRLLVMLEWNEWDKVATEEANEGRGMPNLIRPSSHHRTSSRAAELSSRCIVNIVGIGYVATTSDLSWLLEHRLNHHRRR